MIGRLPFGSSTGIITPKKAGAVMDGLHTEYWRVLQLFGFRLVVMWPKRERGACH